VHQFNGQVSQILQCSILLLVRICRSCRHCSSYIIRMELWYVHPHMGFEFSCAPKYPTAIQMICYVSISGAPDTRMEKEFGIFAESTMLQHLQSIAKENHYQLLDFPETDPAQYISNRPGMERRSRRYRVDVLYPETQLAYSSLTQSILPSISSLSNEIQAHLRFETACIFKSTANLD